MDEGGTQVDGLWYHFHWKVLLQWEVLAWIVGSLLAVAALLLVFDQFTIANVCFMLIASIVFAKIIHVAVISDDPSWQRMLFVFLLFGIVGLGIVETQRGVSRWAQKHSSSEVKTAESQPPNNSKSTQPTLLDLFKSDFPSIVKFTDPSCEIH